MNKIVSFLFFTLGMYASANVHLPAIFADHMVLQRNATVNIWGHAEPNEEITLTADFLDREYKVKANSEAKFSIAFPTPKEGGPYTIKLKGYNEVILKDVLLGEVWLMSGQSNMEMSAAWGIQNGEEEAAKAQEPNIRFFKVNKSSADFPQQEIVGNWSVCTPETMKQHSAVGYFFAQRLHKMLDGVPVAIIISAWGGTAAELWTPEQVFIENPDLKESFQKFPPSEYYPIKTAAAYNAMIAPINSYKIAGAAWYQGETNTGNFTTYEKLLTKMIASWRTARQEEFPFYIIQIAPYSYWEDSGARIRNIQRKVAQNTPKSGLIMTADVSTPDDIHPKNKKPVGERLANLVLKNEYGKHLGLVNAPNPERVVFEGQKAVVFLQNAEGLHFKNSSSPQFELAGIDGKYYPAKAVIKNNTIEIKSAQVKQPISVRYAWKNTAMPDIFNQVQLPLTTFEVK